MLYPKYLETEQGELLIFDAGHAHAAMAARTKQRILSAGLVSAVRHPGGKFFAEAVSIGLSADKTLTWEARTWFEGTLERQPVFATQMALLQAVGAEDIAPAKLLMHEGVHFPSSGRRPANQLLGFFLP